MKAAVVTESGVQYKDAPKPSPKPNEILIKVKAASLNRADLAVASGHRHGTVGGPGTIVGLECAGEVEAVLATAYPNAKGGILDISGATGYIAYHLNERFILSVTLAVRDGKEVVHDDMQLILHDGSSKRRLDLKVFNWEKPKEKQPKSK